MDEHVTQPTPAWLTAVLQAHGHLPQGRVTSMRATRTAETRPSFHVHLAVTYSPEAPSTAPTRLFLKRTKPHYAAFGRREIAFYADLAPCMSALALLPWYGAAAAPEEAPALLLADVSATHAILDGDQVSRARLEVMVDVLARLHATWWEHPRLGDVVGERPDDRFADFSVEVARYPELVDELGDQLTPEARWIFERYLAQAPALLGARAASREALTLCHPDNHHENFLFPRDPQASVYLIDWHVYYAGWGAGDIVALLMRCTGPDQRQWRDPLLRRYHQRLQQHGVTEYAWEACRQDYRLGLIDFLGTILSFRRNRSVALRLLVAVMDEYQRLGCAELFR